MALALVTCQKLPMEAMLAEYRWAWFCILIVIIALVAACLHIIRNWQRNRSRKIWGLSQPSQSMIVMSSFMLQTYYDDKKPERKIDKRPVVGLGQIQALPYVISSLNEAYGSSFSWENIYHANDPIVENLSVHADLNLICIGGSLTNAYTRSALSMRDYEVSIDNSGVKIVHTVDGRVEEYTTQGDFKSSESVERRDVALIVHRRGANGRRIIVLAGGSTYGTAAAAMYFCRLLRCTEQWKSRTGDEYIAVIGCTYKQHPPVLVYTEMQRFISINK